MTRPFRTAQLAIPMSTLGPETSESVRGLWRPTAADTAAIRRGNTKIRNHYMRLAVDNEMRIKVEKLKDDVFTATAIVDGEIYAASARTEQDACSAVREDVKRALGLVVDSGC